MVDVRQARKNACSPANGRQPPGGAVSEQFRSSRGQDLRLPLLPEDKGEQHAVLQLAQNGRSCSGLRPSQARPSSGSSNGRFAEDAATRSANTLISKCGSGSSLADARPQARQSKLTPYGCESTAWQEEDRRIEASSSSRRNNGDGLMLLNRSGSSIPSLWRNVSQLRRT